MRTTVGQKPFSVVDATAVVVKSPDEDATVTCGGQEPDAPSSHRQRGQGGDVVIEVDPTATSRPKER